MIKQITTPFSIFLLLFSIFFSSCSWGQSENPMLSENLNKQKTENQTKLEKLKKEGQINETEFTIILNRLNADCNTTLTAKKTLDCSEIDAMIKVAIKEFNNIKISEQLYSIIVSNYSMIDSMNQARYANVFKIGPYCNSSGGIHPWYESKLTDEDRFNNVRNRIKEFQKIKFEKISTDKVSEVSQRALKDVKQVQTDTTLTNKQIEVIIKNSLEASVTPEMEGIYTHGVANIYFALAKIKKVNDSDISAYSTSLENNPENKPKTATELENYVAQRLDWMLNEGLVTQRDHGILKTTMREDIKAFLHGSENKEQLTERAKKSLSKFKGMELDTEDREFIAETYYDIANRKGINLGEIAMNYLYN